MSLIARARRLLVLAGVAAVFAHAPVRAAEHEWTMQIAAQAGEIIFDIGQDFAERVARMTDGRIRLNILPVGAIVSYNETLDAVSAGLLDGHITSTVYFSGKDPAATTPDRAVTVRAKFVVDEGYEPPQGRVEVLDDPDGMFLEGGRHRWTLEEVRRRSEAKRSASPRRPRLCITFPSSDTSLGFGPLDTNNRTLTSARPGFGSGVCSRSLCTLTCS